MMPDREKYIDILSKTVKAVKEFNEDAPIKISVECVEDILELLKEQEAVVRCKECKHWHETIYDTPKWMPCMSVQTSGNWFCADGERVNSNA